MARWDTFTFRINPEERQQIVYLAEKLRRSQSDAIRYVVFQAVRKMKSDEEQTSLSRIKKLSHPPITPGAHR
jgi:hypothetical protein